jgi:hypothetical protein
MIMLVFVYVFIFGSIKIPGVLGHFCSFSGRNLHRTLVLNCGTFQPWTSLEGREMRVQESVLLNLTCLLVAVSQSLTCKVEKVILT